MKKKANMKKKSRKQILSVLKKALFIETKQKNSQMSNCI